jgi:multiple sugar transport system substrate-binding protein
MKKMWAMASVATGSMLVGALAGCGASAPSTTAKASNGQHAPVTVTLMTWQSSATNQLIMNALKPLEKKYPYIHVQNLPTPSSDYYQKLDTMFTAHQLPDLFWAGNEHEQQWGAENLLYNWTKLANATKNSTFNIADFAPDAIQNWEVNGQLDGLPSLMNTYGVYYNVSMFHKAGLPLPKPGWTYAQLMHDAQVLTQKSGSTVSQYGLWAPPDSPFNLGQYAASARGRPFVNRILDPTQVTAGHAFIQGVKMWSHAIQKGWVTGPTYPTADETSVFLAGKIPMLYGGQWLAATFLQNQPSFKWGFAPMPVVQNNVQPYDAVGICSPAYLKHPHATWLVLSYLDTKLWGTVLPEHPVAPPAYLPDAQPYFQKLTADGESSVANAVEDELKATHKQPVKFLAPWAGNANAVITEYWNNILEGKVPITSTVNTMVSKIKATMTSTP